MRQLWAVVLVVALAAPAAAQDGTTLSVSGWKERFDPLEPAEITLTLEYECARLHPTDGATWNLSVPERPFWAVFNGTRQVEIGSDTGACATSTGTGSDSVNWTVHVPGGPARQPADVRFNSTITYVDGEEEANVSETIETAFLGRIRVTVSQARNTTEGAPTSYHDVAVTNQGNGPMRVEIEEIRSDSGLTISLPPPGEIPWAGSDDPPLWEGTVEAVGEPPEDPGEIRYEAELNVTTAYAEDPSVEGPARILGLDVTVTKAAPGDDGTDDGPEPSSNPLPAPGTVATLLAGSIAVLARFHRRRSG